MGAKHSSSHMIVPVSLGGSSETNCREIGEVLRDVACEDIALGLDLHLHSLSTL